jgi:aspartyl-tRNA(Asn)/glutamyl-tRNA(Gln) amidotransferase subunit C
MSITRTDVEKIAELARLELSENEIVSLAGQLSSILGYIDKLNELDTSGVDPMSHCSTAGGETGLQREDAVTPSLGQKIAVENAPDAEDGYFRVPRVIGG